MDTRGDSAVNSLPSVSNSSVESVNPNANVDELDPLILGASEEVNTSSVCNDDGNNIHSSKNDVRDETFISEVLGLQRKSPLNSPYTYNEQSKITNEISISDVESRLKAGVEVLTNSRDVSDKMNENVRNHNVLDTETSGVTTTVVSEGLSLENARGIVVVEQVALDQINELIASTTQLQEYNSSNGVLDEDQTHRGEFSSESQSETCSSSSNENKDLRTRKPPQDKLTESTDTLEGESAELYLKRFEDLDTKQIAETLANELKKYSIPQAVFARKVLNRSQGTLSDILKKPKPWNELRGGREIYRKMKEWLDLPEVKRIPQLRAEAALELDAKARKEHAEDPPSKRARLYFTDSQKRALFAIFKETKKPSREMQNALAEELGLERGTVANFFMNARRRHPEL